MRKNFMILLIIGCIVVALLAAGAYAMLMPHYKTIEVNGYTFEVPDGDVNVTQVNDNYKTYDDKEHNLTVKSYAINNANQTDYNGAFDIIKEMDNNGSNITYDNLTLRNNSGKYSYFDNTTYQLLVVTCDDVDVLSHSVKSMNKTEVKPNQENLTVNLTNITNTTEENNTTTTTAKKSTAKKSSGKSSKSSSESKYEDDEIYDVIIPGSGGKTVKARWTGTSPEYGARYEEVGTGKIIYT